MAWWNQIESSYEAKKKFRHICKCGHINFVPEYKDFEICSWCNRKVYSNRGLFKKKILEKIEKFKEEKI